jgi:hypothetical protein
MSDDTELVLTCKRTREQVQDVQKQAATFSAIDVHGPGSLGLKCRAEGVAAAIAWICGLSDTDPLED